MRGLGRLAVAVALAAPLALASPAGASSSQFSALCGAGDALPTTNVGGINSVLTNNGVAGPGLLLQRRFPQQLKLSVPKASCLPPPVGPIVVTQSRVTMKLTTAAPVNCADLVKGAVLGGNGTFTWTAPLGMGTSPFSVQWKWTNADTIRFWGSVSSTIANGNVFGRDHISGFVLTKQRLTSTASGGDCTAVTPLTHWTIRSIVYQLKP